MISFKFKQLNCYSHISGNLYATTQLTLFRYTITALRNLGLSAILPLDNNIFIHKVIGTLIFVQAWCHTIMHLINFGVNVQPDPLKFVQINSEYWNWTELGYNLPTGCWMKNESSSSSFQVQVLIRPVKLFSHFWKMYSFGTVSAHSCHLVGNALTNSKLFDFFN